MPEKPCSTPQQRWRVYLEAVWDSVACEIDSLDRAFIAQPSSLCTVGLVLDRYAFALKVLVLVFDQGRKLSFLSLDLGVSLLLSAVVESNAFASFVKRQGVHISFLEWNRSRVARYDTFNLKIS